MIFSVPTSDYTIPLAQPSVGAIQGMKQLTLAHLAVECMYAQYQPPELQFRERGSGLWSCFSCVQSLSLSAIQGIRQRFVKLT